MTSIPPALRTAIDLKRALDNAHLLLNDGRILENVNLKKTMETKRIRINRTTRHNESDDKSTDDSDNESELKSKDDSDNQLRRAKRVEVQGGCLSHDPNARRRHTILAHIRASAEKGEGNHRLFVGLKGTDAEWINYHCQSTRSIPFYSPQFSGTTVTWKENVQEEAEHTGNSYRPHEEDCIYLSYAVRFLPSRNSEVHKTEGT
ncbi:hypothetical protein C8R45DRAFT_917999 [Mycena sanguinolenta]|nr:hypothetical protein C8R45DRAFT_917999 [Mycena sanguinolenta]